jgi:hypothetical protein
MTRGSRGLRGRDRSGRLPTTPLGLLAFGAVAIAVGVAVPIRTLTVDLADVASGQVVLTSFPFVLGLALCGGGAVALLYGLLLLVFD